MTPKEPLKEKDYLSVERTILANDRTLLSYTRTSLSFLAASIGCIKFLKDSKFIFWLGILFLIISPLLLVMGFYRYKKTNVKIRKH